MSEELTLDKLKSHLWESANILRGSIDSSDYKNYIFGMLFLKRLSDVFEEKREELIAQGEPEVFIDNPVSYDFYVPERARWSELSKVKQDIGAALNKAFEVLEEENEMLEGVLVSIDFNDKERLPDHVLDELIQHFSTYNLGNKELEDPDLLGTAYQYLIKQFADDAGKKGGEFYTPKEVVKLLVDILDPQPNMRVYDPCCGSGGMLVYSADHLKENDFDTSEITLFGQEKNLNTWAICKMNMLLHGHYDAQIAKGDTMREPEFTENGDLEQFDIVLANPMWNQKRWSKEYIKDAEPYGRMKYGYPPKNKGDWAWIQHMLASTNLKGRLGIVLDNGALFRSRSEGKIRKKVLEDDLIEAVVALPSNLFANTSSPGCILIFNKDKPQTRKDKVLFIYGEEDYEELSNQNKLREEDLDKILEAYHNFEDVEKYCRVAEMEEIERNDFNLNVPRYVDTTEPEEPVDIQEVLEDLSQLEEEYNEVEDKLASYLSELGYDG